MLIIVVRFKLHPGKAEAFMPAMLENARVSLSDERGCTQFDVCVADHSADEVLLYEAYESSEAFQSHLETDHFRSFEAKVSDLVASKVVQKFWRAGA